MERPRWLGPQNALPCRGAMGIAGGPWRVEISVAPSVSFSIPARRRAFWTNGGPKCPTVRLAGSRSGARGGNADDPKAQGRPVSAVLAKEEPEDRETAQPGHVQDAPGGGKARARSSVLQKTVGAQWELPGGLWRVETSVGRRQIGRAHV